MWSLRKQTNKYKAKRQEYNGIGYHSKREASKAWELDQLVKTGEVIEWKRQVKVPLEVNGHHIANYYVDFLITWKGGDKEFVEIKGFETEVWRLKWKLFEALYEGKGYKLTVEK